LIVINLVCNVLRPLIVPLVATRTTETAMLMNAIVEALRAARDSVQQIAAVSAR
jgi:hypothetical protein